MPSNNDKKIDYSKGFKVSIGGKPIGRIQDIEIKDKSTLPSVDVESMKLGDKPFELSAGILNANNIALDNYALNCLMKDGLDRPIDRLALNGMTGVNSNDNVWENVDVAESIDSSKAWTRKEYPAPTNILLGEDHPQYKEILDKGFLQGFKTMRELVKMLFEESVKDIDHAGEVKAAFFKVLDTISLPKKPEIKSVSEESAVDWFADKVMKGLGLSAGINVTIDPNMPPGVIGVVNDMKLESISLIKEAVVPCVICGSSTGKCKHLSNSKSIDKMPDFTFHKNPSCVKQSLQVKDGTGRSLEFEQMGDIIIIKE